MLLSNALLKTREYLTGPGFFRLSLALLVVLHHNTRYIKIGEFAVLAFFMLSGYWICKMYNEKYSLLEKPVFSFILSRLIRIYPTYIFNFLLVLLIVFVFNWWPEALQAYRALESDTGSFWLSSLFLLSYNQLATPLMFLVPAWSLDIELQFYVLFPFLFFLFTRFKALWVYVTCFLVSVLASFLFEDIFHGTAITALKFFLVGSILYLTDFKPSKFLFYFSWLVIIALLSFFYIHPVLRENMFSSYRAMMWMGTNLHDFLNTALAVAIIPTLALNVKQPSSTTDRLLGNLSYDIYLFHWVLAIPYNFFFAELPFVQRLPYFIIYFCLTIAGSILIYKFVDEPVDRFRRRWFRETKKEVSYELTK